MADTDKNRKEKILESALFDTQAENDNLEKKVQKLEKNARRKNVTQKVEITRNKVKQTEKLNELEQYG